MGDFLSIVLWINGRFICWENILLLSRARWLLAKQAGAVKVALLEPVEGKREVGKSLGADVCIESIYAKACTGFD